MKESYQMREIIHSTWLFLGTVTLKKKCRERHKIQAEANYSIPVFSKMSMCKYLCMHMNVYKC